VADRILSERGIAVISPSNTNPNLTAEGTHFPFYLRTAHNDKVQGAAVASFLFDELGLETMATIHDESPYANALAAVARAVFENKGGTITAVEQVNSADTDMRPVLTTIAGGSPDVLYFPDFQQVCGLIATQAKEVSGLENTRLIGSDGCGGTTFADVAGEAANGMFISGPDLTGFQQLPFYQDELLPAYEEQFGSGPTALFHAHSFDAFNVLAEAIPKVAIEDGDTLLIPRTALKDALLGTSGFEGVTGTITCIELGDCAAEIPIGVYEIPTDPFVGGDATAAPVFSMSLTLAEADELIAGGA
jgi:branched-chain amino acid transport system substrate-binding protein